jgi:hypothetical protein
MGFATGFHTSYPTEIDSEINLAENLYVACRFRWGKVRLPRMLRTDPHGVFCRFNYGREHDLFEGECTLLQGWNALKESRAANEQILTPSHPEWIEFRERLHAVLLMPDYEWHYGASQQVNHGCISTEYWPLASAEIVASLGFAVGESLALYQSFLGDTDEGIRDYVERLWRKTKPRPGVIPFDEKRVS